MKVELHGTMILAVRKDGKVVVAGDGQVTLGNTVMKGTARKVRTLGAGASLTTAGCRRPRRGRPGCG